MKHIFTDVDGTLVYRKNGKQILPEKTLYALEQLRKNGHKLYLSTGRSIFSAKEVVKEFKFDGYACSVGSYLEVDGKVIVDNPFKNEQIKEILEIGKKYNIKFMLEGDELIYVDERWQEELRKHRDHKDFVYWRDLSVFNFDKKIHKISFLANDKESFLNFKFDMQHLYSVVNGINKDDYFGEITTFDNTKGMLIKRLIKMNYLKYDDVIVIGDSPNDVDMLKMAPVSIALGSGTQDAKANATFITKNVDDDGFYHAFKELGLVDA